jgi:hypothetical protein
LRLKAKEIPDRGDDRYVGDSKKCCIMDKTGKKGEEYR